MILAQTEAAGGSALASWDFLVILLVAFTGIVAALLAFGRTGDHPSRPVAFLLRIPDSLERLTGIPGWAAATIGVGLYGLLMAGQGFYSDVAWHIALGRDEELFTAPHTSIFLGLILIAAAAVVGITFATWQRADVGMRVGTLRIPWSTLPLGALGLGAVAGFPLDEVWHGEYGIDVTMWSPTHMLMILGASLSGMASWLVLAEAKVPPRRSAWTLGVHLVAAWLTLEGLSASQGEFSFGVPQFQQLFHPVLVTLAAGVALVTTRLVIGPISTLLVPAAGFALEATSLLGKAGDESPVETRAGGLYIVSAIAVVVVGRVLGTERRLRFAVVSGFAIGTVGLAGEWWWNADAYQPWTASLLPEAAILAVVAGVGAGVIGAAFGSRVARERGHGIPRVALAFAGLAVLVSLAVPMPRTVREVTADIRLEAAGDDAVVVHVTLDPPDAADDARWFQTVNWQGGELVLAEMEEVGPGQYVADRPVPVTGNGKAMVRLHRGSDMMAAPVYFPADPEIGEPEIPAEDRIVAFGSEKQYLMRETEEGNAWLVMVINGLFVLAVAVWVATFALASTRIAQQAHTRRAAGEERQRLATAKS